MGSFVSPSAELARYATDRAAPDDPVVVVAGCGSAGTVADLLERGVDAYGFDLEAEPLAEADVSSARLHRCDLRDEDLLERLRAAFDIDRIHVCYTERVLSILTPSEAATVTARLRAADAVDHCVHRIAEIPPVGHQRGEFEATIRAPDEWRAACDPDGEDLWLSTTDGFPTTSGSENER
ncbi:hypothetical protein [Natronolimnohabitans innermongolicus]|uniref:Methyltransferase type 11 n=1 Tax=Natronolimnohabitans innermongolicus JCM 12255 TaxID=1227499 RepID=L9XJW4_9EURY|nr:hypothetical protein [Natronolimnohabitans innermongolicus]ELY60933.1 hypothetical protein C493_03452 [Natronolimnohabitans innermongolicus JCM 12255]